MATLLSPSPEERAIKTDMQAGEFGFLSSGHLEYTVGSVLEMSHRSSPKILISQKFIQSVGSNTRISFPLMSFAQSMEVQTASPGSGEVPHSSQLPPSVQTLTCVSSNRYAETRLPKFQKDRK